MGAKERKDAANEVKVLSSLKHPYIVAYKDSFIEDGFLNIVMEYADGGDLFTKVQKARKSMTKFPEQPSSGGLPRLCWRSNSST